MIDKKEKRNITATRINKFAHGIKNPNPNTPPPPPPPPQIKIKNKPQKNK